MDLKLACLLVFLLGLFLQAEAEYLWHNDEIPYDPDAKCKRGYSYYSNSVNANDTDIDVGDDVESLLDYNSNSSVCFFCVCSVSGNGAGCITRDEVFCQFYREARDQKFARDAYTSLFQQDRPAYFRQLSYRMRRTMDLGITEYVEIANQGLVTPSCIPFLSEYNDCNDVTSCKGCNKCTCDANGQWQCYNAFNTCDSEYQYGTASVDDDTMDGAVNTLIYEIAKMKEKEKESRPKMFVPAPPKPRRPTTQAPSVLAQEYIEKQYDEFLRLKRSAAPHNVTKPGVKFYHTVDEINEDTLKNSNVSGTLPVKKVDINTGKSSRRSGVLHNTSQNPLHIQYNDPKVYNHHFADNKIDSSHTEDKYDVLGHEKLQKLISNFTNKDKDLSKLVVNELKTGKETIGDKKGPVMSNITFTPENDTLTAMAFIAGNLLNKLWNLEKEASDDSIETEVMKHQKIAELLELFKEPMTYRQETFLKNALERLSDALNKNKNINNVSLCETVEELQKKMNNSAEDRQVKTCDHQNNTLNETEQKKIVIVDAVSKMNDVLSLLKKFEDVEQNLHFLKHPGEKTSLRSYEPKSTLTEDEMGTMNLFGNILNKLTNLLIPNRNRNIKGKIRAENILSNAPKLNEQIKKKFNINIDNTKLSPKDKLILDYISKIQTNPCFSSSMFNKDEVAQNTESNILLNLSEFFKIKSMSDLLQLVDPEHRQKTTTTTEPATTTSPTSEHAFSRLLNNNVTKEVKSKSNKPTSLKERLRIHLKTIFNDLIEIQRERGGSLKPGDLNIAEALPCLFNMLNDDKIPAKPKKYSRNDLVNKVKSVLETVRRETKNLPQNRRFNMLVLNGPRPKSAVVWERLVKNLDNRKKASRRNLIIKQPTSFEDVKKTMDKIESESSNTYKSYAFIYDVAAADKLVFLKMLDLETTHYVNVLKKLELLNEKNKLPLAQLEDIKEFVDNAAENIDLNERIVNKLTDNNLQINTQKQKRFKIEKNQPLIEKTPVVTSLSNLNEQAINVNERMRSSDDDTFKLTRDQILNQLIKNRVELYLRLKEAQGLDLGGDMKYSIAKRIVTNLENGNYPLARELFKIFVDNQRQMENYAALPQPSQNSRYRNLLAEKQPLVNFEKPKVQVQPWQSQDHLLKQLLNMRNMK